MKNPLKHKNELPPRLPPPLSPSFPTDLPAGEFPSSTHNLSSLFKGLSPHRRHHSSGSTAAAHQDSLSPLSPSPSLSPSSLLSPRYFRIAHEPDRPRVPVRLSDIPSEDECRFLLQGLQDEADALPTQVSCRDSTGMNKETSQKSPALLRVSRPTLSALRRMACTTTRPTAHAKTASPPSPPPAQTANADSSARLQRQTKPLPDLPAVHPRPSRLSHANGRSTPLQPRAAAPQDSDKWNHPRAAPLRPGVSSPRSAKTSASAPLQKPATQTAPPTTTQRLRPPPGPLATRAPIASQHQHRQGQISPRQAGLASFSQRVMDNGLKGVGNFLPIPVAVVPLSPPPRPSSSRLAASSPRPSSSRPAASSPSTSSTPVSPWSAAPSPSIPASSRSRPNSSAQSSPSSTMQMAPAPLRARRPDMWMPRVSSPLRQSQTFAEAPAAKKQPRTTPLPSQQSKPLRTPRWEAAVLSSGTEAPNKTTLASTGNEDAALAEALASAWRSNGGEPLLEWDVEAIKASLEGGRRPRPCRSRTPPPAPLPLSSSASQPHTPPQSSLSPTPSSQPREDGFVSWKQNVSANRAAVESSSTALAFFLKGVSNMPTAVQKELGIIAIGSVGHRRPQPVSVWDGQSKAERASREKREAERRERRARLERRARQSGEIVLAERSTSDDADDDSNILPGTEWDDRRASTASSPARRKSTRDDEILRQEDSLVAPDFAVYEDPDIDGAVYANSWPESRYYFSTAGYNYDGYDDDDDDNDNGDGDDDDDRAPLEPVSPVSPVSPMSPPLPPLPPVPSPSPPPELPPAIPHYRGPAMPPKRQQPVQQSALVQWRARRASGL